METLRGIEWKAYNLLAKEELAHRKPLTEDNIDDNDILNRDWF